MTDQNNVEEEEPVLQREIERLIDKALKERLIELGSNDIKIIAKEMMPNIDKAIAKHMKKHFYEIGQYLTKKFDKGE